MATLIHDSNLPIYPVALLPEEYAEHLYNQMKGVRIRNSHAKTCAIRCISEMIKYSQTAQVKLFLMNTKKALEKIKTKK